MIKSMGIDEFNAKFLEAVKRRGESQFEELKATVQGILDTVKRDGDPALLAYGEQFDNIKLTQAQLLVSPKEFSDAYAQLDLDTLDALKQMKNNIATFHEAQKRELWYVETRKGVSVGQLMRPLERVGLYVPGGKALYPSTVIMTAVPAKIAGVKEVILCTPPLPDGSINPLVLVAAKEAGVDAIYKVGGVQAIGAMTYGTETISPVNKIVGPGNKYVNAAKLIVSTTVGIDLPAGPSEVLIIADETANPEFIAIDLISQAEHDENAYCFLVTPSRSLIEQVQAAMKRLISKQVRRAIIEKALKDNGYLILSEELSQAIDLCNEIAPEHLEIQTQNDEMVLSRINNAGAIFMGKYSPVPVGDYAAGSNHVLPTGGSAKIYSGLSLFSFMKLIDVVKCSKVGIQTLAPWIQILAGFEGLDAHLHSIQMRLDL